MKNAIISVNGGVADIETNEHSLNIEIIDFDNDGVPDEDKPQPLNEEEMVKFDAVLYVLGGVAEVVYESEGVEIEIIDYDNEDE